MRVTALVEHDPRCGHRLLVAAPHHDDLPRQDVEHVGGVGVLVGRQFGARTEREGLDQDVVGDDQFLGDNLARVGPEVGIAVQSHAGRVTRWDLSGCYTRAGVDGWHAPARHLSDPDAAPVVFPETLETERLRFERLHRENVAFRDFYDVVGPGSESMFEYVPRGPVRSLGEAADRLTRFEREWDDRERAEWALRPKEGEAGAGRLAGFAGLVFQWEKRRAMPAIRLRERFWGRGYSGERIDALLEVAFERLDLECVTIPVHAGNERSKRAVEKYVDRWGGRYEGLLRNDGARADGPADRHRFSITRAEYEASK